MRTKTFGHLLLFGILLLALGWFYGDVLLRPNQTLMGASGDALKNYYTPWYHAKWDSTYTWFEGMNYPYGDHLVFADAQPLLSNSIKVLGLANYTVGIMNCAMLLSLVLAAWLLFRILLRWEMDPLWAAAVASAIALLSPQLLRMNGHFGLAYAFVVPLIWLLALRAYEQPGWLRGGLLCLVIFLLGWLHPYYVMISAVFLTAFASVHAVVAWRGMPLKIRIAQFGIQVILPVALFALVLKATDPVTDRPGDPYGFDQYMATWKGIFFPFALSGLDQLPQKLFPAVQLDWEGVCYIGFAAGLAFLIFWINTSKKLFLSLFRRKLSSFKLLEHGHESGTLIKVSMLTGLLVGLFACGVPFAFKSELTTELFPPIKQFRSLGRFSWVFFYTWMSFAFFLLWGWWKRSAGLKRYVALGVGTLAIGWTLFEGAALNHGIASRIAVSSTDEAANAEVVLGASVPAAYDSLLQGRIPFLQLPYWHEGSENFHALKPVHSPLAFRVSLATGSPMLNVMMSRTSFSQSWNMMQFVLADGSRCLLCKDLPPEIHLAVIRTADSTEFDESYALGALQDWRKVDDAWVMVTQFLDAELAYHSRRESARVLAEPLYSIGTDIVSEDSLAKAVFHGWDDNRDQNTEGYDRGSGLEIALKDNNFIHDGPLPFQSGDTVEISLWAKIHGDRLPTTELGWEEWKGENRLNWHYLSFNNSIKRLDGEWALIVREEVIRDAASQFKVNVTRWKRLPPTLVIDHLLIRKKGSRIIYFHKGMPRAENNDFQAMMLRE